MRRLLSSTLSIALAFSAAIPGCSRGSTASVSGSAPPAGTNGQPSEPRTSPAAPGASLETAPANVAELKPAFRGQTRAPALKTQTELELRELARGLNKPWAIAFLPDGRLLVTEKPTGHLYIVTLDGKRSAPVAGLPRVDGRAQGGLLDVEVARDYAQSALLYWSYSEPREGGNGLSVARGKLVDGSTPSVREVQVIFRMQPALDSTQHSGGRLVLAPDGNLFVTLGERFILEGRRQARDLDSHLGKIVRIAADGSPPAGNPFVGRKDARPEIWTLGHRNVLSAALDRRNRLWIVEMGPRGGDELNLIERGNDYGWPTIGYGEEYSGEPIHQSAQAPGLTQPVYYWDPVISPSGLTIYKGDLFPEWKDDFLIGGLSSRALIRLTLKGDRVIGEERLLTELGARIREVVEGPEGALYLLTDDENGKLLKLTPRAKR